MGGYDQPLPREWEGRVSAMCSNDECSYYIEHDERFEWEADAHLTEHYGCELVDTDGKDVCAHCDTPPADVEEIAR